MRAFSSGQLKKAVSAECLWVHGSGQGDQNFHWILSYLCVYRRSKTFLERWPIAKVHDWLRIHNVEA